MNINENKEIENSNQSLHDYIREHGHTVLLTSLGDTYTLIKEDILEHDEMRDEYVNQMAFIETIDICCTQYDLNLSDATRVTHYTLKKLEMI